MMCGPDVLLLAVQLAVGLIGEPYRSGVIIQTAECNPVKCGGTAAEVARWQAAELIRQAEAAEKRDAEVREFRDLAKQCGLLK